MNTRIFILTLVLAIMVGCGQSIDLSVLSKFKETAVLSHELHQDAMPGKYQEISKDLIDKYLKNFDYKEFESSKLLKFYAIERMLVDADFYILTLGIDHDLTGKPHTSLILITVDNNGQVLAQIPLEGYWDKRRYDYKKIENLKVDDETKKFSGVEIYIDQGIYNENFESYTLEGTAVKSIQKDGSIIETEFFEDEDFVEGVDEDMVDMNVFLSNFKTLEYPVDVELNNTGCKDILLDMHTLGYDHDLEGSFSPCFRLAGSGSFNIVIMRLHGDSEAESPFFVFSISNEGVILSSMEVASFTENGDNPMMKSAKFDKQNQFTLKEEGSSVKITNFKFDQDGLIQKMD